MVMVMVMVMMLMLVSVTMDDFFGLRIAAGFRLQVSLAWATWRAAMAAGVAVSREPSQLKILIP